MAKAPARGGRRAPAAQRPGRFCCYLLSSDTVPKAYVGYATDPRTRLRRHNGDLNNGAASTRKGRPWRFVAVVDGFTTAHTARFFEWGWLHPADEIARRKATEGLRDDVSARGQLKVLARLVALSPARKMPLRVHFIAECDAEMKRAKARCAEFRDFCAVTIPTTIGAIASTPMYAPSAHNPAAALALAAAVDASAEDADASHVGGADDGDGAESVVVVDGDERVIIDLT